MSYERDLAFLEDYRFMLATGESHDTAARRIGVTPHTLTRRVERATVRTRRVRDSGVTEIPSTKIGDTTKAAPARAGTRVDPGPNHRQGVAS